MKLRWFTVVAAMVFACAPAAMTAQTATITQCSTVAASNVAKSTEKTKLVADVACLDRAGPLATAQIAAARKARVDRQAALSSVPIPTPTSMPMPMAGGYVPSPTLDGAAPFHVAFDIAKGLGKSWGTGAIPALYTTDLSEGAFRFVCGGDGPLKADDPVVYPGQPGKSHLHLVAGNKSFNANSTSASLAEAADTNCSATPYSLNRSAYWMPALLNDLGQVIRPDVFEVYYKRPTSRSANCTPGSASFYGKCVGLPNSIRYVFGWDPVRPDDKVVGASWYCTAGTSAHYSNLDDVFASGCTAGSTLVANQIAQNCWDGKNLDSPDHRRHVANMFYDGSRAAPVCPKGYPYIIPQEENKVMWTVTADMIGTRPDGTKYSRIRLSCDAMIKNGKPGQCNHADYWEQWDASAKALWMANCIEKALSCSGGDLGNGQQLIGAAQPAYGWVNPTPREPPQ